MSSADEQRRKAEKPAPSLRDALDVLEKHWAFEPKSFTAIKFLDSYDDCNFFVAASGKRFLVKCYNGVETDNAPIIAAQTAMMAVLTRNGIATSRTVPPQHGSADGVATPVLRVVDGSERPCAVRVCEWVDGEPLVGRATPELLLRSGALLGRIHAIFAAEKFDDPGLHRYHQWDQRNTADLVAFTPSVKDPARRQLVEGVIERFRAEVLPVEGKLRRGALQADFNDANIILGSDDEPGSEALGVIDFGDIVNGWIVSDVAIAAAYATVSSHGKSKPFDAAARMIRGFASVFALEPLEVRLLPLLIACRLTTSVVLGAYSVAKQPDCEYLLLHAAPAWASLGALASDACRQGMADLVASACDTSVALADLAGAAERLDRALGPAAER